jgi:hypothetical protein
VGQSWFRGLATKPKQRRRGSAAVIVLRLPVCRRSTPAAACLRLPLALLAVCALAACLSACGGSSAKPTPLPSAHPHRDGPESMFTVGAELYTNSAANMNLLQSLGVGVVRLDMRWTDVAPDPATLHKPAFDASDPNAHPAAPWARYDALIRGLTARHIGIDLALIGRRRCGPRVGVRRRGAPTPNGSPTPAPMRTT